MERTAAESSSAGSANRFGSNQFASNTVRALAFCVSTPTIKSRVHFFPTAGVTSGPYSINCLLTLFGKGIERRTVMLDGGRLGQPDGIRLEDAFAALRGDASGLFGLEVRLSCSQGRVNLLSSQASIEVVSAQSAVLYSVAPFTHAPEEDEGKKQTDGAAQLELWGADGGGGGAQGGAARTSVEEVPQSALSSGGAEPVKAGSSALKTVCGVGLLDWSICSSLVILNGGDEPIKPDVARVTGAQPLPLQLGTVAPHSVVEVPLDDALFKGSAPHECVWGLLRAESLAVSVPAEPAAVAYYLMYRDPQTKRPISVVAL
jgi:hypothetical protein